MDLSFLIEGRREKILDRFSENPELRDIVEKFLDHEFNRRTNYKYVDWVVKRNFDDIGNQLAPFDEIITYLERFDNIRKNLDKKDINQYISIGQLYNTIEQYGDTRAEEKTKIQKDTEKIFENNEVLVVKPKTQESSCYYGSGTKWCTAATRTKNMFNTYIKKGPLYYLIFKNLGVDNDFYKLAIHYDIFNDKYRLYDAKDNVNENLLGFIKDKSAFKAIKKDVDDNYNHGDKIFVISEIKNLFKNLNTLDLSTKWHKVINGKPLYILDSDGEKLRARYGVRDIVLTVKEYDFLFYVINTNIMDQNPIDEVLTYIQEVNGIDIVDSFIRMSPIVVLFIILEVYIYQNKEELNQGNNDIIYWSPNNIHSNYRFESLNPENAYIKFLNYIIEKENAGEPADKRDFLLNVLNKDPEEVNFSGYFSTMFGSMKDAGLVTIYRAKKRPYFRYNIGPNYKAWREGRLKRI